MKKPRSHTIPSVESVADDVRSPRLVRLLAQREKIASKERQALQELPKLRDVADGYIKSVARIIPNQTKCAAVLGISPITLNKRLERLGIHIASGQYTHS